MAGAAICQATGGIDVVSRDQLLSLATPILRWVPCHVVNFIARPDVLLRCAMAIETPLHVKRLRLVNERHLIDAAVAG